MDKQKRNKLLLYVLYGMITVLFLVFILSINDIGEIMKVLGTAHGGYVLLALLLVVVYIALYPITLVILCRAEKMGIRKRDCYTIGMTEHFFNGITPFATGGQPFQLYAFSRKKQPLSTTTGVLVCNFIIFMLATNTYSLLSLIYFNKFAIDINMQILSVIGFTANFMVLLVMIALATSKRLRHAIVWLIAKLSKIKFLKKLLDGKVEKLDEYIKNTQDAFKTLWKHKGAFFTCYGIRLITLAFYYATTFFILLALGVSVGIGDLFYIICGSAFAITMVVFLPTPGSAGGIEFAFASIFSVFVTGALTSVSYGGMLMWRLMTYYFTLFISLAFYIVFEIKVNLENKKQKAIETSELPTEMKKDEEQ